MHPEGRHLARIVAHGYVATSKGTPQLAIDFETEHGPLRGFLNMTDKSAEYSMKAIRSMGYKGNDLAELAQGDILKENSVELVVKHETFTGSDGAARTVAKVKYIDPVGGGEIKRIAADKNITRLNAVLKKEPVVGAAPAPAVDEDPFH